ncbi:MAG: oligosaccharide repeat unit polymerase [Fusobacteriaceae bacterium]|jgi:oligosaccharide repeat unit polymerase|nr:oligosaccharide repeat unit polymerase [Fusobacteriaceae bacterium]
MKLVYKINTNLNPFYFYAIIWILVLLLYKLEISKLYPKLSNDLIIFLLISLFLYIIAGIVFKKKFKGKLIKNEIIKKRFLKIYILIIFLWIINFIYVGAIPLFEILKKSNFSYKNFKGIKTIYVFLVTYTNYLSIYSFYNYLLCKRKINLIFSIIGVFIYLLVYSRSGILFLLMNYFIIFLILNKKIKNYIIIGIIGGITLYSFGILGNIRHYYKWNDTSMIKKISKIEIYQNNFDPFIWSYVYITSPLGNLQYNINYSRPSYNIKKFISENLLLDAINKRISDGKTPVKLMVENLTVSTMYISSYLTLGMHGMYIISLLYLSFNIIYIFITKNSNIFLVGISLLCVLNIFSIFDNSYIFSGFSFSLIYPLANIFIKYIKKFSIKRK